MFQNQQGRYLKYVVYPVIIATCFLAALNLQAAMFYWNPVSGRQRHLGCHFNDVEKRLDGRARCRLEQYHE